MNYRYCGHGEVRRLWGAAQACGAAARSPVPVAHAVQGCRLQQVIAGVVEQLGIGPHAVGDVLGAELLHAPPYLKS